MAKSSSRGREQGFGSSSLALALAVVAAAVVVAVVGQRARPSRSLRSCVVWANRVASGGGTQRMVDGRARAAMVSARVARGARPRGGSRPPLALALLAAVVVAAAVVEVVAVEVMVHEAQI